MLQFFWPILGSRLKETPLLIFRDQWGIFPICFKTDYRFMVVAELCTAAILISLLQFYSILICCYLNFWWKRGYLWFECWSWTRRWWGNLSCLCWISFFWIGSSWVRTIFILSCHWEFLSSWNFTSPVFIIMPWGRILIYLIWRDGELFLLYE